MPRIRTIKPEFWGDEKLAPLSPIDRLVFLGLISMADDAGRVPDSIRAINGFVFPETDDSAALSLDVLTESGRVNRGVTRSGQRVIQIVNWKHQKIEKPNLSAALPPIVILDESSRGRRNIPAKLRDAILDRDGWVCQCCGIALRRDKRDRYDSGPDLAEVDHVLPVRDGGTEDPENLQALCLGCNRKKAGEDVRRRNGPLSPTNRGNVADSSAPHINDLLSPTSTSTSKQHSAPDGAVAVEVGVVNGNGHSEGNGQGLAVAVRGRQALLNRGRQALAEVITLAQQQASAEEIREQMVAFAFAYWQAKHNHPNALQDRKREGILRSRLRENRNDLSELLYAADGARKDRNLMGENERSRKYDGIETIYRDRAQVERLASLAGYQAGAMHPQVAAMRDQH